MLTNDIIEIPHIRKYVIKNNDLVTELTKGFFRYMYYPYSYRYTDNSLEISLQNVYYEYV